MIDFHSHILPAIDDGAKDAVMAEKMLTKSEESGVSDIVLTSHCYPRSEQHIERFLEKRARSLEMFPDTQINTYKGCEVHLTTDISKFRNIRKLCIENTNYMLLEMPFSQWRDEDVENVYKLTIMGINPIIAHMERNAHQKIGLRNSLCDLEVLVQINAQSFGDRCLRKEIDRLMNEGLVHVIGTDMHNITSRPPCMDRALKIIKKRYGGECIDYLENNAQRILSGQKISYRDFKAFKKQSIFKKGR